MKPLAILVFPTQLGWMAVIAAGATVKQLTFGHSTAAAARAAIDPKLLAECCGDTCSNAPGPQSRGVGQIATFVHRLQAYALGVPDEFRDIRIDPGPLGEFQRRVLDQCRRVRYGCTISYAALAAKAGYPNAARAVGNCMAANPIPLIVPCHRVVRSDGRLGSYSASGGTEMKRRLLALEGNNCVDVPAVDHFIECR